MINESLKLILIFIKNEQNIYQIKLNETEMKAEKLFEEMGTLEKDFQRNALKITDLEVFTNFKTKQSGSNIITM